MKIISVEKTIYYSIITDDGTEYRRISSGCWERLWGSSWEPEYSDEQELETLFQLKYNNFEIE